MHLFNKHKELIYQVMEALPSRNFHTIYPENPKEYNEELKTEAESKFQTLLNQDYQIVDTSSTQWIGNEISPYLQVGLGIKYPKIENEILIQNAQKAFKSWSSINMEERAGILVETLEVFRTHFFDVAYATMHTSGQGFMMAFQASGPHAADRALETICMGFDEQKRFPERLQWDNWIGKNQIKMQKTWKTFAKGIGLVIGCSTFPVWNSITGIYANLICGNPVICKPHPNAVLPLAILVNSIKQVFHEFGINTNTIQMAVDEPNNLVTKELAQNEHIKLIDYTGGTSFGNYIETLPKITFTEKSALNAVIIESAKDIDAVATNLAFSLTLYSRQMCTAPQNIYITQEGIKLPEGNMSAEDFGKLLSDKINNIYEEKWGIQSAGCVQSDEILKKIQLSSNNVGVLLNDCKAFKVPDFENARTAKVKLVLLDSSKQDIFLKDIFGPICFIVKSNDIDQTVQFVQESAKNIGTITCSLYCNDFIKNKEFAENLNQFGIPISYNFINSAFVNQHFAFSDLHGTGGNMAGNTSFVSPEYINKRFFWVGNRSYQS